MTKDAKQLIVLFDMAQVPFKGQASKKDPRMIPPGSGYVSQAVNLRFSGGVATVRDGIASDKAAPVGGGVFMGGLLHELGKWQAIAVSGKTRVYQWNGASWTEITDASTRFNSTTAQVNFSIIQEPIYADVGTFSDGNNAYIVWQNGEELPRIRNCASDFVTYSTKVHQRFEEPYVNATFAQPRPLNYFNTQSIAARTNDGGGTASSSNQSYSTGGNYEQWAWTTGTSSGKWAQVRYTTPITLSSQPTQLHIVFNSSDAFIFENKLRVSLTTSSGGSPASTRYIVYDPDTNPQALQIVAIDDKFSCAIIDLQTIYDTSLAVVTTGFPATSVDAIRFDWMDSAPAAAVNMNVYYVGFGANVRFGVQAKAAYFGSMSRAESRGVVCQYKAPPMIGEVGGTPIANLRLPQYAGARYRLTLYTPKSGVNSADATHIVWYIQRTPGGDFEQCDRNATSIGSYASQETITVNIESEAVIPRTAPDDLYESIPISYCSLATGDRLVCGNARQADSSITSGDGEVWWSEAGYMHRFSRVVRFRDGIAVPESAGMVTLPSGKVQRIIPISGSIIGADKLFIFASRGVFSMDGSDASQYSRPFKVTSNGTRSPWSVVEANGYVYYLDTFRQVRSLYGSQGERNLSLDLVDDKLSGIPDSRIEYVTGAYHNDCFYLGFTPSGGTDNEQILIFDERIGGWYTDSTSSALRWERLYAVEENEKRKLFFSSGTGAIYQHENSASTTDSGTEITSRLKFGEIAAGWTTQAAVESIGVCADVAAGKFVTTRRYTAKDSAAPSFGKIPLDESNTDYVRVYRWDRDSSDSTVMLGKSDFGVRPEIELAALSGTRIYGAWCEARVVQVGADRA